MGPSDVLRDLELLLRSGHGLVQLEARDEARAATLLELVANRLEIPFLTWTRSRGLLRRDMPSPVYETEHLEQALTHVVHADIDALYHFQGVSGEALRGELIAALVRDAARAMEGRVGAMVMTGGALALPESLEGLSTTVRLPGPSTDELRALLGQVVRDVSQRQDVKVSLSREETAQLLRQLSGLTLTEAGKVLTRSIVEDGSLDAGDIANAVEAKRRIVERDGLLEYYPVEASLADVADLTGFKGWLAARTEVVRHPARAREAGLPFPRGVLLLGVPGCGKSLSAKAVAAEWQIPLLRLDPAALYNKYIGESERNFKRAMHTAEAMAPVILWIDELEKAFAAGGTEDGGVSQRILGTFLSWLQERKGDVFVVATANEVQRLPPEFLRKGRFDEVFFVDLPDSATRKEIFRIHLAARDQDPSAFPLAELAAASEGFSGSEIEQVVVSALYDAFADHGTLSGSMLEAEIARTRPLSVTMAEPIDALRRWAQGRTVGAN